MSALADWSSRSGLVRATSGPVRTGRRGDAITGLLLAGAVGVAAALRLRGLAAVGFGSDEAVYAAQARSLAEGQLVVRAHPPLGTSVASLLGADADDASLRLLAVGAGLVTVVLAAALAAALPVAAPRAAAVVAAWVVALMPYSVEVSRQFILDGPAAAAAAVLLLALVRWEASGRRRWLYTAAVATVVAVLLKESALLVVGAALVVALAVPSARGNRAARVVAAAAAAAVACWLSLAALAGEAARPFSYAEWQLGRAANASPSFYWDLVLPAIGPGLVIAAALGAALLVKRRRALVVVAALVVPVLFFQLWPVKGFGYLSLVVPAVAALASLAAVEAAFALRRRARALAVTGVVVATGLGAAPALAGAETSAAHEAFPLPGRDGLPAVREAAQWIAADGDGAVLAGGTAVGNVIAFYANRPVHVIGHGTGDRRLNPAYRTGSAEAADDAAYLVWDAWTAQEQPPRAEAVLLEARQRGARVAYTGLDSSRHGSALVVVFEVAS